MDGTTTELIVPTTRAELRYLRREHGTDPMHWSGTIEVWRGCWWIVTKRGNPIFRKESPQCHPHIELLEKVLERLPFQVDLTIEFLEIVGTRVLHQNVYNDDGSYRGMLIKYPETVGRESRTYERR